MLKLSTPIMQTEAERTKVHVHARHLRFRDFGGDVAEAQLGAPIGIGGIAHAGNLRSLWSHGDGVTYGV
jgi:hypothetical protein